MSSQEESLNYLIGNFVQAPVDSRKRMQTDNMVSIDTSNGFLGFNTIDPSYHIDVVNGTIRTSNLILTNIPDNSANVDPSGIYHDNGTLKIKL